MLNTAIETQSQLKNIMKGVVEMRINEHALDITINTDLEYVEYLICNMLYIESDSILKVFTLSESDLTSGGRGLVITFNDGNKYCLSITKDLS